MCGVALAATLRISQLKVLERPEKTSGVFHGDRAFRSIGIVLGIAVVLGTPAAVFAQAGGNNNCSLRTVKGWYAGQISGWAVIGAARVPYGATGSFYLDGRGTITPGAAFQSVDGAITPIAVAGTYTVDPSTCTGEAVSTIGTFFFAIVENGKETRIIGTTPGTTVTGEALRQ